MKKKVISIVLVFALSALAAYAIYWTRYLQYIETTDNAYLKTDNVLISPKVSGYVTEVLVRDNQPVHAGQVLAKIETSDYEAKVEQLQAGTHAQQAALVTLDRQKSLQRSQITQAKAVLAAALAQLSKANLDLERNKMLLENNFVTKDQVDSSRLSVEVAEASVARCKAELQAAEDQLEVTNAKEAQNRADLQQSQALAKVGQLDLNHATLAAPIDGFIGNKAVEVGQYVKVGTQMMTIVPLEKIFVVANFKETQLKNMRAGQKVTIQVDAYSGTKIDGIIESIAPATGSEFSLLPPENATGNFTKIVQRIPVKITLPTSIALKQHLRPGMSVAVSVNTAEPSPPATIAKPDMVYRSSGT